MGNQAIATLQGDFIKDAVKDRALGALTDVAQSALSNYADGKGFGDVYNTAADVLEDGEVNSSDLRNAARRAVDNSATGGALAGASELASGVLANAEGLADTLLASAAVTDAVDHITAGLRDQATALGDDLKDSISATFATETGISEQLTGLQNVFDSANNSVSAEADNFANMLRERATATLNTELDQLEQDLKDSLDGVSLDRDAIIDSFTAELDEVAYDLVGQSTAELSTRLDDLQSLITDKFGALEINPDTIAENVLDGAKTFIGEQAETLQTDINLALGQLAERGESLLSGQLQTTLAQARQHAQEQVQDAIAQQGSERRAGLPDYE